MRRISIIFVLLLLSHFLFSETVEELEDDFKALLENGKVFSVNSLIGLEISDELNDFLDHIGSFMVGDVNSDLSGYFKVYENLYVLIMTKSLDNGDERLIDVKIIPKSENEYLSKHTGFIDDENVDSLTIITDSYPPFYQETIDTYRLCFYFDHDRESIVDVTDRKLIVYND